MSKYHLNGNGEPGICTAKRQCPFGDMGRDHYATSEEARKAYEGKMRPEILALSTMVKGFPDQIIINTNEFSQRLSEKFRQQNVLVFDEIIPIYGKKFIKLVTREKGINAGVYCFIDRDGNILKAATWAAPAKGIRFSLTEQNIDELVEKANFSGGWLYRK